MPQLSYNIVTNEFFGRHMVSNRKIKEGELILKESPILVGPQINGALLCFKCCKCLRTDHDQIGYEFCKVCQKAILCKTLCQGTYHSSEECSSLKNLNISGKTLVENSQVVFALRSILLQKYNPELFKKIMQLEHHVEKRRDTPIWRHHKFSVEKILFENNFLQQENVQDELVQKICGILDVNTFEIRPPEQNSFGPMKPEAQSLRGLYLTAAMMNHSCLPNTHLSVDEDFILYIYASTDIEEGRSIFFNYANVLQGTSERKEHLRQGKYFNCVCARCKDPTELGTELSSLRCHKCRKGLIRPCSPELEHCDWECSQCHNGFKHNLIGLTLGEANRRIEDVDKKNILEMETLLKTLLQTFHPNHYVILELIQYLISAYSTSVPNTKNLSRKIHLCKSLLEVFCKIEPGLSRIKAISLYELQSATVNLAHKKYRDAEITLETLVSELLSAEEILKQAVKLLLYEPSKSPEGRMAQMAIAELKMLRISVANISRDLLVVGSKEEHVNRSKQTSDKNDGSKIIEGVELKLTEEKVMLNKKSKKRRNKNK